MGKEVVNWGEDPVVKSAEDILREQEERRAAREKPFPFMDLPRGLQRYTIARMEMKVRRQFELASRCCYDLSRAMFDRLPDDIKECILSRLTAVELGLISSTCKSIRKLRRTAAKSLVATNILKTTSFTLGPEGQALARTVVMKFPKLHILDFSDVNLIHTNILSHLLELRQLNLARTPTRKVYPLANCLQLRQLDISSTAVNTIEALHNCRLLEHLVVRSTKICSLSGLRGLNLRSIDCSHTFVNDLGPLETSVRLEQLIAEGISGISNIVVLKNCTVLSVLSIWSAGVEDLSPLVGTELSVVNISGTKVKSIVPLSNHVKSLTSLSCFGAPVDDIAAIDGCEHLSHVDMSYSKLTNIDAFSMTGSGTKLEPLRSCKAIKSLSLRYTQVCDISALASLSELEYLDLEGTLTSDTSPLQNCHKLVELNLCQTEIDSLDSLNGKRQLRVLLLKQTNIEDLLPLSTCTSLRVLDLESTAADDLSPLVECRELRTLKLTDTSVCNVSFLSDLQNLQTLLLGGTEVYDIRCLIDVRSLKAVDVRLSGCSDEAIRVLSQARPDIAINCDNHSDNQEPAFGAWSIPSSESLKRAASLPSAVWRSDSNQTFSPPGRAIVERRIWREEPKPMTEANLSQLDYDAVSHSKSLMSFQTYHSMFS